MNTLILEDTEMGEVPVDVYTKLANDRILFICDQITDELATDIVATLLHLDEEDCESKITLFINSSGGDIRNVLMICDIIKIINSPVETVCIGEATHEAVLILTSGTPGIRYCTKNAIFSVSQLMHDYMTFTTLSDAKNLLDQSLLDNKKIIEILSKTTKKTKQQIIKDFDRKVFMTANQALKYGLIDEIITPNK